MQIQDRSPELRPVASECVCDWLRDATGLHCGDRSLICNATRLIVDPLTSLNFTPSCRAVSAGATGHVSTTSRPGDTGPRRMRSRTAAARRRRPATGRRRESGVGGGSAVSGTDRRPASRRRADAAATRAGTTGPSSGIVVAARFRCRHLGRDRKPEVKTERRRTRGAGTLRYRRSAVRVASTDGRWRPLGRDQKPEVVTE